MLNDEHKMGTTRIKGLNVLFYFLIANAIFDLILTLINCFIKPNYFSELISFSLLNVLIFAVVLIITLIITVIPVIFGQRYQHWTEEKQLNIFFKTLTILSLSFISLASFFIFITIFTSYPSLMNPFSLNTSNPNQFLLVFSPLWWFFSFNVGLIIIFLLYIYLES